MNADDVQIFYQRWSQARLPRSGPDAAGDKALWDAALFLTKHVLRQVEPGELGTLVSDLEQAGPFPTVPAKEQLNRLLECIRQADGPSRDEAHGLLRCIAGLLEMLRDVPEEELRRADHKYYIEALKQNTLARFSELTGYHEGEGNYGLACFYASQHGPDGNLDEEYSGAVLYYLTQAVLRSRGFIGRARVDSDFYHLHQHEEFRALLELTPAQAAEFAI